MSHTPNMPDSAGDFTTLETGIVCRKCKEPRVTESKWESSCGGYEDYKYTCAACGFYWWEEGIDS